MVRCFYADLKRFYFEMHQSPRWFFLLFELALYPVILFRVTKCFQKIRFSAFRKVLLIFCFILSRFVEIITGIKISSDSEIGPGLLIHNHGGIVIHGKIGTNFTIVQGAQMISSSNGKGDGWPQVGNSVFVGAGAKLVGNICVGDGSKIGSNAVVAQDVPANSLVMPPVSRVVKDFYS